MSHGPPSAGNEKESHTEFRDLFNRPNPPIRKRPLQSRTKQKVRAQAAKQTKRAQTPSPTRPYPKGPIYAAPRQAVVPGARAKCRVRHWHICASQMINYRYTLSAFGRTFSLGFSGRERSRAQHRRNQEAIVGGLFSTWLNWRA